MLAREWDRLGRETREERAQAIDALRKQQAELNAALAAMQARGQQAWRDARDTFVQADDDVATAWDDATETETE